MTLVNASGTWASKSFRYFENQGNDIAKAKYSSKGIRQWAGIVFGNSDR
jgi:uncharacterized protein YkuJ